MSHVGAASLAALSPARAAASRKNGAKSRGPKTPAGKARSARNALKHGFRAQKFVLVGDEDPRAFAALEAALLAELAPVGALQSVLAQRIVAAAWRLERAERIEAELFAREMKGLFDDGDLGLALIRDGNGAGAFNTLLRYRGAALAEFWRALRTLQALQAPQAAQAAAASVPAAPIEPERRAHPGESAPVPMPAPAAGEAAPAVAPAPSGPAPRPPTPRGAAPAAPPIEPETRSNPGEPTPSMPRESIARGSAALLSVSRAGPVRRRSTMI